MGPSLLLLPMGHVAVAARSWRHRGRSLLTVVVKGTFDLRQDGPMTIAQPAPIVVEERHLQNNPVASLLRGSDLALVVPKPEVVVVGAAFPGPGRRAPATSVRLTVQRERTVLIDKQLDVVGDLRAPPGAPLPAPAPFERMPIQYERALGGMMSRENPVGRGMEPDRDGQISHPNVLLPQSGGVKPAGFGPIPSVWPGRRAHRGSLQAAAANTQLDVDVPADLEDAYFQTAPADQRVAELLGGELITLVHLHPQLETLRTYLPTLRGVALLQSARGDRVPVPLRMDTVHLEPEAMRAEIVFRGVLAVAPEQLEQLRIAGALETPDRPFTFPDLATVRAPMHSSPQPLPVTSHASTQLLQPAAPPAGNQPFAGTMLIEQEAERAPDSGVPFKGKPGAPPAPPPPLPTPTTHGFSGTVMLTPDPPTAPHAAPAPRPASTMFVESAAPPQTLPFQRGQAVRAGQAPVVITSKAATPWSEGQKLAPVQSAAGVYSTLLADDGEDAPAPPPPQAPAPPAPPAAPAEPARDPSKPLWREDPPAAAVVVTAPAPKPVIPPRTDVKGSLYKKAKR